MRGCLALILHAHLPYVRHPEVERFLEEDWLFEAITETYVPLLKILEGWKRDDLSLPLTLTLTPPLCAMLRDPLLQSRYRRHLDSLIELAARELHRTTWDSRVSELANFYHQHFLATRDFYERVGGDLVGGFRHLLEEGRIEIITSAATHAVLPLLASNPASIRAQIMVARDAHRACFGRDPQGIWLPECAYAEGIENVLREAGIRWFITDTHGLLNARPRPRYGIFAPILTPAGVAAFGRDHESARQVWSRNEGYPGDPAYRDFYRDIGFDLDLDYLRPHLPAPEARTFTGIKYYRITGPGKAKELYYRPSAIEKAGEHAAHFLASRKGQLEKLTAIFKYPIVVCPYDAELFGHWWYEGPEFLDSLGRLAERAADKVEWITPTAYLQRHPTHQVGTPAASSWGEHGYWQMWLNDKTQWIYPHLETAHWRMTELARRFPNPHELQERALKQAGRELLLAQASDWAFIMRTGTSPSYGRKRITEHLVRFTNLYEELLRDGLDEEALRELERRDNIFPELNFRYWNSTEPKRDGAQFRPK